VATVSGGKVLERRLAEMTAKLSKPATLRVGFLAGSRYPDGTPVALAAAINEFGAPRARIPARPFFRNMIAAKRGEWPKAIAGLLKANDYDAAAALDVTGHAIEGQLRESIAQTFAPPLSPVTLMLRKMKSQDQSLVVTGKTVGEARRRVAAGESTAGVSTKPLVESGHLLNSVDHEVNT
jgi:hypothetical protein